MYVVLTDNVERHAGCQSFSPPATRPWKSDSMKLWFWCKRLGLSNFVLLWQNALGKQPKQGRVVWLQFRKFQFTGSELRPEGKQNRMAAEAFVRAKSLLEQPGSKEKAKGRVWGQRFITSQVLVTSFSMQDPLQTAHLPGSHWGG